MQSVIRIGLLFFLSMSFQNCLLINYASKRSDLFWLLVPGVLLLFLGLKKMWKYTGKKEVPAYVRFLHGLLVGISIFLA